MTKSVGELPKLLLKRVRIIRCSPRTMRSQIITKKIQPAQGNQRRAFLVVDSLLLCLDAVERDTNLFSR